MKTENLSRRHFINAVGISTFAASNLILPTARTQIKGNNFDYYKEAMNETRAYTKLEMKKRDDDWLLSGETKQWDWNNYCKWFHVAEHFANHRGQMTWYAKRLPQ